MVCQTTVETGNVIIISDQIQIPACDVNISLYLYFHKKNRASVKLK